MKLKPTPSEIRAKKDAKRLLNKVKCSKPKKKVVLNADHLKGRTYSEFLASKYWYLVRQMVLKRDNFKCIVCSETKNLQIHHNTYKNHFKEHKHLDDLMTLCKECHKQHHHAQM